MQTAKTTYHFKLALKERRPFFTVFLASFVTAHVVMPSDDSVEEVIRGYDERTRNRSRINEDGEPVEPPAWLKELVEKSFDEPIKYKIPTLETHDSKAGEPITRGFVVQPKHQKVLLKMFRQGLIQLFEPLSHVPVDPEIGDFFLRDAKLSFDDFVKFANEIGIEVTCATDVQALVRAEQPNTTKVLGTREKNTLLVILAAACKEANLDYTKPAKTAAMIEDICLKMGLSIGNTTIEGHLKSIPNALEARMK